MKIAVPKETYASEKRIPLTPDVVAKLIRLGCEVIVESAVGETCGYQDKDYEKAGATISDRKALLASADVVCRLRKPPIEEVKWLKKGAIHISYLDPFNEKNFS